MKSFFRYFIFIIFFIDCLLVNTTGQVSSKSTDKKVVTAYSLSDSIFVFHQFPFAKKGNLSVANPFGTKSTYTWNRYDTLSNSFGTALRVDSNVLNSSIDTLSQGGYKITLTGTTRDTSFMAWVYFNNYSLAVEKNNDGNVKFGKYTCEYVDLSCKVTPLLPFIYEDPNTYARQILKDTFTYFWSAEPAPEISLINGKAAFRVDPPPYIDTRYKVKVTDKFGLVKEDQVFYKTIQVKAEFDLTYQLEYDTTHVFNDGDKKSAPLKVNVFNKSSEKADTFIWYFVGKDTAYTISPTPHFYYQPDTFKIKLFTQSAEGCVDTITHDFVVEPANIEDGEQPPNVFTPDGNNPMFKISNISIRQFKITIFTRWGKLVYTHQGIDMLEWEGWDGNIGNSKASTGVYYYVLEVFTWDKKPDPKLIHTNGRYSGFFYLFR